MSDTEHHGADAPAPGQTTAEQADPATAGEPLEERLPHPTHVGLNIAKAIADDRPEQQGDGLTPHPEPDRVAAPVREVLPDDGRLPSSTYLDQIAAECGETLGRVWELPEDDTIRWVRDGIARGLGEQR